MPSKDFVSFIATEEMLPLARSVREIIEQTPISDFRVKNEYHIREVIPIEFERFADGVSLPQITQSIRNTKTYVFYTPPLGQPDLGYAELEKILNAAQFGAARIIKLVLPHFWEGRADRKSKPRVSMNTRCLARIIDQYARGGMFTFDLHAEQIALAFNSTPVDDLKGQVLLAEYLTQSLGWNAEQVGVIAADGGGVKRAEKFAEISGFPFLGFVYKERKERNAAKAIRYIGDAFAGRDIIMPDDIIDTAGTLVSSGGLVLAEGAKSVTACVSHWVASPKQDSSVPYDPDLLTAEAKLRRAGLRVFALNTIPRTPEYLAANADFLTMIPCDSMLAYTIMESLTPGGSVSKLSEKRKT